MSMHFSVSVIWGQPVQKLDDDTWGINGNSIWSSRDDIGYKHCPDEIDWFTNGELAEEGDEGYVGLLIKEIGHYGEMDPVLTDAEVLEAPEHVRQFFAQFEVEPERIAVCTVF